MVNWWGLVVERLKESKDGTGGGVDEEAEVMRCDLMVEAMAKERKMTRVEVFF